LRRASSANTTFMQGRDRQTPYRVLLDGPEDFTLKSQQQMLDSALNVVTLAVAALGGI